MPITIRDTLKAGGDFPLLDNDSIEGGLKIVSTTDKRDLIPDSLRNTETLVFVVQESSFYELEGGLKNSNWKRIDHLENTEPHYFELTAPIQLPSEKAFIVLNAQTTDTNSYTQVLPDALIKGTIMIIENHGEGQFTLRAESGKIQGSNEIVLEDNEVWIIIKDDTGWHGNILLSGHGATSSNSLEIDDSLTNVASVKKINVEGMMLTQKTDDKGQFIQGEVTIKPKITFDDAQKLKDDEGVQLNPTYDAEGYKIRLFQPLQAWSDPDVQDGIIMEIKHDAFEPMKAPSFLAYLKEDTEVIGKDWKDSKHHAGALWFDDVIYPAGTFIQTVKDRKAYGIQEADQKDPNVTGGTNYLVAFRVGLKGNAPNDGYIKAYIRDQSLLGNDENYMIDVDSNPLVVEHQYKSGDKLQDLLVLGIVNAKGLKYFTCNVLDNFVDDFVNITDPTESVTGLMIQALRDNEKTGVGRQQFELDTWTKINFSSHYLGVDRFTLDWIVGHSMPAQNINANSGRTSIDGLHFYNVTNMKAGISGGHLLLSDNGTDMAYFNVGKIFSSEETQMLRGKQIKATVILMDHDDAFNLSLVKWTGKPDQYTTKIITGIHNLQPQLEQNWTIVDTLFIPEDITKGDHSVNKTFTVPVDANNYGIIIYPEEEQTPNNLSLKQLKIDVVSPFVGYVLHDPELLNELHFSYSDRYKEFTQDNQGFALLRYTINNRVTPLPVGIAGKGLADVSLNTSLNQISGSQAKGGEGVIEMKADGTINIMIKFNCFNEQSSDNTVTFYLATYDDDTHQFVKIATTEDTYTIKANSSNVQFLIHYVGDHEKGTKFGVFATSNKDDGAYLQSNSPSKPLVKTTIDFKELVSP